MKLVVGLGNPGREYAGTRHNVGFDVVDVLAKRHGFPPPRMSFRGAITEGRIGEERVLLLRPLMFMNLSGDSVAAVCRFYKLTAEDVIVISDDVALPLGKLRLRPQGSAGGHNGLDNIIARLGTDAIPRVRIGVGASRSPDMRDHVLSRFRPDEQPVVAEAVILAADAIETAIREDFVTAMNRFNVSDKPPKPPKPPTDPATEPGLNA